MSFSLEAVIPKGQVDNTYSILTQDATATGNDDCPVERDCAIEQAAKAVQELLLTHTVGNPDNHIFSVRINGHVNPGNKPRDGWANDCLVINISQMKGD